MKLKNKSFTLEEIVISLLVFLISLSIIFTIYSNLLNAHISIQRELAGYQNIKFALDKIYADLKIAQDISTSTNKIEFIRTSDCATITLIYATSPEDGRGYLEYQIKNNTTTLTDVNLVDIKNFNYLIIKNIASSTLDYFMYSVKLITISLNGNFLNESNSSYSKPFNIQLSIFPLPSSYNAKVCNNN
jgi:type II secretory pathway component PulJ